VRTYIYIFIILYVCCDCVGIAGVLAGSLTNVAMNSNSPANSSWAAVDGGNWFISDSITDAPNGDYSTGCFLGVNAIQTSWSTTQQLEFDDKWCDYSTGTQLITLSVHS
jgi:hypothetical protein